MSKKRDADTTHTHTPQQHNTAFHSTAQQHSTAQPFTRVCLEFLTTLTCRALYGKSHCHGQSCRFLALVSDHFDFRNTARESHCVGTIWDHRKKQKNVFSLFFVSPGHHRTIQYLIPGCMTIVKLLKQVKNWQSPSRDRWSNCLFNSREDDKGQSYYYSGRQKDNSKTICGRVGYSLTQWILHPESSFTLSPRSTTLPLYFDIEALTPNSWDDKDPSMTRNETFCPYSLLLRSPLCFWLLSAAMPYFACSPLFFHCRLCIWNL